MVSSTSDKEDFVASPLNPVKDKPREKAILSRLIVQGQGSSLDSDSVRGKIPVFETDVPDMQVGVINTVYSSSGAVTTGTTVIPVDDTIPQKTEGDEKLTATITPSATTNLLYIEALINVSISSGNYHCSIALFQDDTADAIAVASKIIPNTNGTEQIHLSYRMLAGTTSSTTFKIRVGPGGAHTITVNGTGGARLFGGVFISSLRVMEVVPN